jgi:hypothetical protein
LWVGICGACAYPGPAAAALHSIFRSLPNVWGSVRMPAALSAAYNSAAVAVRQGGARLESRASGRCLVRRTNSPSMPARLNSAADCSHGLATPAMDGAGWRSGWAGSLVRRVRVRMLDSQREKQSDGFSVQLKAQFVSCRSTVRTETPMKPILSIATAPMLAAIVRVLPLVPLSRRRHRRPHAADPLAHPAAPSSLHLIARRRP